MGHTHTLFYSDVIEELYEQNSLELDTVSHTER